jgi:hypothetical protein
MSTSKVKPHSPIYSRNTLAFFYSILQAKFENLPSRRLILLRGPFSFLHMIRDNPDYEADLMKSLLEEVFTFRYST